MKHIRFHCVFMIVCTIILGAVFAVSATESDHQHNWEVLDRNLQGHTMQCSICEETRSEAHSDKDPEVCWTCGLRYHTHEWTQCVKADSFWHTMLCEGCGQEKTTSHSFFGSETCSVCGYENHEHIWVYDNDARYDNNHELHCTKCDGKSLADHTYGEDGTCTVCGALPPHIHEWSYNGEYEFYYHHFLACACGQTKKENHTDVWDGVYSNSQEHRVVCTVCGRDAKFIHVYYDFYVNGECCVVCGYEKVKHSWKYASESDDEHHKMKCRDCDVTRWEAHRANSRGDCSVCGYHMYDVAEPVETEPAETKPAEPKPVVTEPTETSTEPAVTQPQQTETTEPTDTVTEPSAPDGTEAVTEPAQVEDVTTEPAAESVPTTGDVPAGDDFPWVVVVVGVIVVAAGAAAIVLLKKKKA